MNFISAFDELNKLYEEAPKAATKSVDDLCAVMLDNKQVFTGTEKECNDFVKKQANTEVAKRKKFEIKKGADIYVKEACNQEKFKETFNVKSSDGNFEIVTFAKSIHDQLIKNGVDCTVSLVDGFKIKVECDQFDGKAKAEKDDIDALVMNTKALVDNNLRADVEDHGSFRYYMLGKKAVATQESVDAASLTEGVKENIAEFIAYMQKKSPTSVAKNKVKKAGTCVHCGGDLEKPDVNDMCKCSYCGNSYYKGEQRLFCLVCGGTIDVTNDCTCEYCDTSLTDLKTGKCAICGGKINNNKCTHCGKAYDQKAEDIKEELEIVEDEIEIVDDEAPAEEVSVDEPKQTIIECSKCGALVIVDEVEVDEESDLVNMKDECKFCEEKEGYKIIGSVVPYEAVEEVAETEEAEETEEAAEAETAPELAEDDE